MSAQRILVIEDEPGARDALRSLLADDGYAVCTAESGSSGLDRVRDFHPDTVICDVVLPDIGGLEVMRRARALAENELVFIIVTAGGSGAELEKELRDEADLFLEKPLNLGRFSWILRHLLPRRSGRAALPDTPRQDATNGRP
jgi:two-component system, OmpR family, response regulator